MKDALFAADVGARIPAGWSVDTSLTHAVVIVAPRLGYVTIDLKRRAIARGFGTRPGHGAKRFRGRGWRNQIVDAAVSALRATERTQ